MKILPAALLVILFGALTLPLLALQINGLEYEDGESLPTNTTQKSEWIFARFHYDNGGEFGAFRGFQRWAADYPKSDRQFIVGVRRLTRLDTRPTEQVIDANSDDIFNWPWIFVEDAGAWRVSQTQAARLRDYLLKGGFIMFDDTHGDVEWEYMMAGIRMVFPDRDVEELADKDEVFHVLYDLDDRFQIPGTRYIWGNRRYTADSAVPKWRGIRDDQGRLMVVICHNSDVGDAWEWADSPRYPEAATSMAYKLGINYIMYSMTH